MSFNQPYTKAYCFLLILILIVNLIFYYLIHNTISQELMVIANSYLIGKGFLIFANITLPFKYFHYNRIIFQTIISLILGLMIFFLFLRNHQNIFLILIDCGLCLISVFSLMKMHKNRNARKNIL